MNNKIVTCDKVQSHDNCAEHPEKFVEPKLTFIKPELEKQGSLENLTKQGFFGIFPGQGS